MRFCERCGKYLAVIYLSGQQGGKTDGEGLCLTCARAAGLTQVDEMIKKMGITGEDLEQIQRDMVRDFKEMDAQAAENP